MMNSTATIPTGKDYVGSNQGHAAQHGRGGQSGKIHSGDNNKQAKRTSIIGNKKLPEEDLSSKEDWV